MTADGHEVTYTPTRNNAGEVYVYCECSCGLHHSIHVTRIDAGKTGADHLRVVEQLADLAEQASIR